MANFKIAEQFVMHIRMHRGFDGRVVINQTELAKTLRCNTNALRKGIKQLTEGKIINRSPDPDPGGYAYWFTDDMMTKPNWQEVLYLALEMNMAKSSHFSVRQKFGMFKKFARDLEDSFEDQLRLHKEEVFKKDFRIKELEEENSFMRFEMNRMFVRMQELEAAHNSLVATVNTREQKTAAEANATEVGK